MVSGPDQVGVVAERADEAGQVVHPERPRQVAHVLEEPHPVGPVQHPLVLLGGEAGGDEVPGPARLVDRRDQAVAGAGERAGALRDLAQDGVEVEARADAQDSRAQGGDPLAQRRDLPVRFVVSLHGFLLPDSAVHPVPAPPHIQRLRWL